MDKGQKVDRWQKNYLCNADSVLYMLRNEIATDCTFVFRNGEKIKAHSFMLIQASWVFQTMFSGRVHQDWNNIEIMDTTAEIFRDFLRIIYSEEVKPMTAAQACELYILADKYDISRVMNMTFANIRRKIDVSNVIEMYGFLRHFNIEAGIRDCKKLILNKSQAVLENPNFVNISKSTLLCLLDEDWLNIESEIVLYNAVIRWFQHETSKKEVPDEKALFDEIMSKVRFLSMKPGEFAEGPGLHPYLRDKAFDILANMTISHTTIPLPPNISRLRRNYGSQLVRKRKLEDDGPGCSGAIPQYLKGAILSAILSGDLPELERRLTAAGDDLSIRWSDGFTMLHWAIYHGREDVCRWLIQRGIDVNLVDEDKRTALHEAIKLGRINIARLLINSGANSDILDSLNRSSIDVAYEYGIGSLIEGMVFDRKCRWEPSATYAQ